MAGVEAITGEILREAEEKAGQIIAGAEEKASGIRSRAEEEARALMADRKAGAERDARAWAAHVESQNRMTRRQKNLAVKQDIIAGTIRKAYEKLDGLDAGAYFSMIEKLVRSHADAAEGEIFFSEKDLKRMPDGFSEKIAAAAADAGGKLELSEVPADIDNGFILRYGGIDENCTLSALFDDIQSELQDEVNRILFLQ